MKVDDDKARAFDLGAPAHEQGHARDGGDEVAPYFRDAWFAGWDASHFYGLQRSILCAEVDD